MPKLYSSDMITKTLESKGFVFVSQKGSHIKYQHRYDPMRYAIVPANKKEIPIGTFRSVLRQSKLNEKDFKS